MKILISELVKKLNGKIKNVENESLQLVSCASLESAKENEITFFNTESFARQDIKKLTEKLKKTMAGIVLTNKEIKDVKKPFLIVENPKKSFQKIIKLLHKAGKKTGISKTASIDSSVEFEDKSSVFIGDFVVLKNNVKIGKNVEIDSLVSIKNNSTIGENTRIDSHVSIESAKIGKDCSICAGVRIGSQGFGYASSQNGHDFIEHIGRVEIGNEVNVGANSCIDRGMLNNTIIGDGTKIDNLVMIGHGCVVGKNCLMAGQAGLAGGTILEDFVICGGQSAIGGHLTIEAGTQVAGQAGVISNLKKGIYMGFPAEDRMQFLRKQVALKKLIK
ncbi:MAG: UDP-3-O-(3-hydroxymyristoyl)glucosamine N-acyltransferase [Alphaproteobacteria bacterium]|nr:MAG: hypothetical protein B6I23_02950 [Rickettsiaceae bacterium 4572_127]